MKLLFLIISCAAVSTALCQGCSDAGFCSLSVLKNTTVADGKHLLNAGVNYGNGEANTNIFTAYLEYRYSINKRWALQGKLNAVHASGFLGSYTGAGDAFVFVTYSDSATPGASLTWLGGLKAPLNRANGKNSNGKPLPLDYQSSIGTWDAIAGINYIINNSWEFNAGVQVPVVQVNQNSFFPGEYTDSRVNDFVATNRFRRKTDVLLRAGYYIKAKHGMVFKPNLLAIYHTGDDSYENIFGKRMSIPGSQGFTVNAGIAATKTFTNRNVLECIIAAPFVVRKQRPDGLTRSAVVNLQYSIYL